MASRSWMVVCAWCNETTTGTSTGLPVTHTICPSCLDWSISHPTQAVQTIRPGYFGDFYSRDRAVMRQG